MPDKSLLNCLAVIAICLKIASAQAHELSALELEETKRGIIAEFSKTLNGPPQARPMLILIGGYPGSGKTTLVKGLRKTHDIAVISLDAIRQSLIDRGLEAVSYEEKITQEVYLNLLRIGFQHRINLVLDSNASAWKIRTIEHFLETERPDQIYKIAKICLNPPVETLFDRVLAREQKEGLHQGTESDLRNTLISPLKKIDLNDYHLILNNQAIPFETELKIVNNYLDSLK